MEIEKSCESCFHNNYGYCNTFEPSVKAEKVCSLWQISYQALEALKFQLFQKEKELGEYKEALRQSIIENYPFDVEDCTLSIDVIVQKYLTKAKGGQS
jgi:hypothetical protein